MTIIKFKRGMGIPPSSSLESNEICISEDTDGYKTLYRKNDSGIVKNIDIGYENQEGLKQILVQEDTKSFQNILNLEKILFDVQAQSNAESYNMNVMVVDSLTDESFIDTSFPGTNYYFNKTSKEIHKGIIDMSDGFGGKTGESNYVTKDGYMVRSASPVYSNSDFYYMGYMFNNSLVGQAQNYWLTSSSPTSGQVGLSIDFGSVGVNVDSVIIHPLATTSPDRRFLSSQFYTTTNSSASLSNNTNWTQWNNIIATTSADCPNIEYSYRTPAINGLKKMRFNWIADGVYGMAMQEITLLKAGPSFAVTKEIDMKYAPKKFILDVDSYTNSGLDIYSPLDMLSTITSTYITYQISFNNGVTFEDITPGTLLQKPNNTSSKIRLRFNFIGHHQARIRGYSIAWS
jgi:hypothetical protein